MKGHEPAVVNVGALLVPSPLIIPALFCLRSVKHNWETMKTAINDYIGSLNWGYKVALKDKNVNYVNAYAEFVEPHKIKVRR